MGVGTLQSHAPQEGAPATYLEAIRGGDWWAAEALYDRVYGKSKQRHEVEASSGPIPVAELETWSDERISARLLELEQAPAEN